MALNIMTYNVDMRSSKNARISARISALATYIQFTTPDIICFQELGSIAHSELSMLSKMGPGYKPFIGDRDLVTLISINATVHSHNNIKFLFNPRGGNLVFTKGTVIGKGFAAFTISMPRFQGNQPFSFINVHLDPHEKNRPNRCKAFKKMAHFQAQSGCSTMVMAGDFNEPHISALSNPCGYNHDNKSMITHHHADNVRRKSKNQALRKDWVVTKNATIVADSVSTHRLKFTGGEDVSDHSPVLTSLM